MASRWPAAPASVPISRQHNRSSTRELCPIQQLLISAIGLNQCLPSCMDSTLHVVSLLLLACCVLPSTTLSSSPDPGPQQQPPCLTSGMSSSLVSMPRS